MRMSSDALWDSFWAEHASSVSAFHRLLWYVRRLFARAYAAHLAAAGGLRPTDRLLEVGCGSARTLAYLAAAHPANVGYALDRSPDALRLARRLSPALVTVAADAVNLPWGRSAFGLVFSIGLLEHFERRVAAAMVQEMRRVIRPGGVVAVMVPWRNSLYNLMRLVFGDRWPFGWEQPFGRRELIEFMRAQGFQEVSLHVVYVSTLLVIGRAPDSRGSG